MPSVICHLLSYWLARSGLRPEARRERKRILQDGYCAAFILAWMKESDDPPRCR